MAGATPGRTHRRRRGGQGSKQVIPLELIRGRPFLRLDTGLVILDTSAPVSGPPTIERQRELCVRFSGVLGMDRLRGETVLLDAPAGRAELGAALGAGEAVPIVWRGPFPCVEVMYRGNAYLAALDTGGALALGPEGVVRGGRARDVRWEAFGALGLFELETAIVRIGFGCSALEVRAGVIPGAERTRRARVGLPEWVLGTQVLLRRRVLLDFAAGRLVIPNARGMKR